MHINQLYINYDAFYIILNTFGIMFNTSGIMFDIFGFIFNYILCIRPGSHTVDVAFLVDVAFYESGPAPIS